MSPSSLERKLVVLLIGCKDLPGHRATGVNDAYVSLRVVESYQKLRETQSSPTTTGSPKANSSPDAAGSLNLETSQFDDIRFESEVDGAGNNIVPMGRHATIVSPKNDGPLSSAGGAPFGRRTSSLYRRQSLRRGSLRTEMTDYIDPSTLETVIEQLEGQKYQSTTVQSTSNPEYGQVFVFDHLQIPLKRRSSSTLLNNTLTGGSDPTIARQAVVDRHKLNSKYFLKIDVHDTTTSKGMGERFCYGEVQLDELMQGKRTTLWIPLAIDDRMDNIIRPNTSALESLDGLLETPEQLAARIERYKKHPKIGLVLEPVNFGVLPESVRGESTEKAIWRALKEELSTVFSEDLLLKLHSFLVAADADGVETFHRDEVVEMMQELYFFTGTPAPADVDLAEEVQYLMALFDRSSDDGVNISELCGIIKMSKFALTLRPKWIVGKKLSVVTTSSIAGSLWEPGCIPAPYEYAGFRKTNGAVYERTKRQNPSKLPLYQVKPYVNLYNELYANEEARNAKVELERMAQDEEEEAQRKRDDEDHSKGIYRDDTTPMFVAKNDKTRRYTAQREERSLALLFAPPKSRSAKDDDLPTTFHEHIDHKLIEFALLQQCTVKDCVLVCCRIRGGRYINCSFESCLIDQGAEIIDAQFIRCCDLTQCRVSGSEPVNCRMAYTALRECPLVAQCSLFSCDLSQKTLVVQTYLKECMLDPTVIDDGANKMDVCRFLDKPKQTLMDQLLEDS